MRQLIALALACAATLSACEKSAETGPSNDALQASPYAATVRDIEEAMAAYHFNPSLLASSEYRAAQAELVEVAAGAASDDAFLEGFAEIWSDGPFSHVSLSKAQGTALETSQYLDTMTVGPDAVSLSWTDKTAILTVTTMMGVDTIAYIEDAYEEVVAREADRLIIDLRENGGGAFAIVPLIEHVLTEPYEAGGFASRKWAAAHARAPRPGEFLETEPWTGWSIQTFWADATAVPLTRVRFEPRELTFDGPVIVLTSSKTASAAELAADALRGSGRARLVGEETAGEMLSQKLYDVAGGFHLAIPIADYFANHTGRIEGAGVRPDTPAPAAEALDAAMAL